MNRYDHWQRRVRTALTVDELVLLWTDNLGEALKDDPRIVQIFRDRKAELRDSGGVHPAG